VFDTFIVDESIDQFSMADGSSGYRFNVRIPYYGTAARVGDI
jgi:hypothetical protein